MWRDGIEMQDRAVLIIHGIQGHSRLLRWLEDGLKDCADVYNLLLPGHGGDVGDFVRSGMEEWQDFVDARAMELKKRYRRVYYAGHSMGCLLGLDAGQRHPGIFDGMVLLACPLRVRLTWQYIRQNYLAARHPEGGDCFVQAARLGCGINPKHPAEFLRCWRQFAQLLVKIGELRRSLKNPAFPVLAYQPEMDEIVSRKSIACFEGMENVKTAILPGCGHNYYTQEAKERALEALKRMM